MTRCPVCSKIIWPWQGVHWVPGPLAYPIHAGCAPIDDDRAVLAGLRRQVTEWRESSIVGRRSFVLSDGTDSIMSAWHNGRTDMADAVLALTDLRDRVDAEGSAYNRAASLARRIGADLTEADCCRDICREVADEIAANLIPEPGRVVTGETYVIPLDYKGP